MLSSYDNDVEMQDVEDEEEDENLVEDALGVDEGMFISTIFLYS